MFLLLPSPHWPQVIVRRRVDSSHVATASPGPDPGEGGPFYGPGGGLGGGAGPPVGTISLGGARSVSPVLGSGQKLKVKLWQLGYQPQLAKTAPPRQLKPLKPLDSVSLSCSRGNRG